MHLTHSIFSCTICHNVCFSVKDCWVKNYLEISSLYLKTVNTYLPVLIQWFKFLEAKGYFLFLSENY